MRTAADPAVCKRYRAGRDGARNLVALPCGRLALCRRASRVPPSTDTGPPRTVVVATACTVTGPPPLTVARRNHARASWIRAGQLDAGIRDRQGEPAVWALVGAVERDGRPGVALRSRRPLRAGRARSRQRVPRPLGRRRALDRLSFATRCRTEPLLTTTSSASYVPHNRMRRASEASLLLPRRAADLRQRSDTALPLPPIDATQTTTPAAARAGTTPPATRLSSACQHVSRAVQVLRAAVQSGHNSCPPAITTSCWKLPWTRLTSRRANGDTSSTRQHEPAVDHQVTGCAHVRRGQRRRSARSGRLHLDLGRRHLHRCAWADELDPAVRHGHLVLAIGAA